MIKDGYKDAEIGVIPVEWDVAELRDIGKVSMCKRIMKSETTEYGEIPFYKIGTFGKEADAYISQELYTDYKNKYSFPTKGDILISADEKLEVLRAKKQMYETLKIGLLQKLLSGEIRTV